MTSFTLEDEKEYGGGKIKQKMLWGIIQIGQHKNGYHMVQEILNRSER